MSPILLDRQRRLREIGRIRTGHKKMSSGGKSYPAPLESFRLTSKNRSVLEQASELYGGEVNKWEDQWEVITATSALPVIVPPVGFAFSAWYELWSAAGCLRRCDGQECVVTNEKSGERSSVACLCDLDNPECKPTTRLSVILRDLDGVGIWRCESHGNNALDELEGTIGILASAWGTGQIVPATLRIEKRESKQPGKPRHDFVVPVLDVELSLADVFIGRGVELGAGAPRSPQLPPSRVHLEDDPSISTSFATMGTCPSVRASDDTRCLQLPGHEGAHRNGTIGWTERQAK